MTLAEIEEKTNVFLANSLNVEKEKISPEARLKEDMEIDSLDYIDIVVFLDKEFGIKIQNPSEMADIKTLSQFNEFIYNRIPNNYG